MKLIHNFKSPNFNERKSKDIKLIIIHYTAIKGINNSIKYLCSKKNKVSSHYLISKNGEIFSLVSEKKRAWHAGQSYWRGARDINSVSIGIGLDYVPDINNKKSYSKRLIKSLSYLINKLTIKYKILSNNVLGHSDISPYRKIDPGFNFPWKQFYCKKLDNIHNSHKILRIQKLLKKWFSKNKFNSNKKVILFMLDYIGYDISLALLKKKFFKNLMIAYLSRYHLNKNIIIDEKNLINNMQLHFINILLTK